VDQPEALHGARNPAVPGAEQGVGKRCLVSELAGVSITVALQQASPKSAKKDHPIGNIRSHVSCHLSQ